MLVSYDFFFVSYEIEWGNWGIKYGWISKVKRWFAMNKMIDFNPEGILTATTSGVTDMK